MSEDGKLTEAAIAELKSKFPGSELNMFVAPDGTQMVVRSPDRAIYNAFMADVTNEKKDRAVSIEAYVKRCIVYPDLQSADVTLSRYPAFAGKVSLHLNEMAGSVDELDVKKL